MFMTPWLALLYVVHPRAVHRFVGYLEETACITYANIIRQVETPGTPLHEAWSELPAPALAKACDASAEVAAGCAQTGMVRNSLGKWRGSGSRIRRIPRQIILRCPPVWTDIKRVRKG